MRKIIRGVLLFRIEYFITPLFITLCIFSLIYIGFNEIKSIMFNIILILEVPAVFYGLRISRRALYEVYEEYLNED